jgi:PmbA protein
MLDAVVKLVRGRGATGDAMLRDEASLSLRFESGRLKENAYHQERGLNLRVVANGRPGVAGTTDLAAPDDVVARAFASAAEGEELTLDFPAAALLPSVDTFDERVAGLTALELAAVGRGVVEQLQRRGWQVNGSVDRYVETTAFANTSGQSFLYRATALTVSADVTRVAGDDVLMTYDYVASVSLPGEADLAGIVNTIVAKMHRSERVVEPPEGRLPVLFTPQGSGAVLLPLRQALSGKTVLQGISPLEGRIGEAVCDASLSLADEPLLQNRVGTRPADDEGVPSARLPLIEDGVLKSFVYDLETAARAGSRSTGHGRRSTFGKPSISFSNLVMKPGTMDEAALLAAMQDGLIVDELIGVGQGNVVSGAFSHPVALAWRVQGGVITGRVKDAAVAGNAYELLKRIRAVGSEARWQSGTRFTAPLLLDGVSVSRR